MARSIVATSVTAVAFAAARAADYQSTVLSDNPKAYYRLNDSTTRARINVNSGTLGAAGNATNDSMYYKGGELPTGVVHPFPGAIVGDPNRSEFFDFTTRTEIPWNAAFNTPNTQPFTVEAWFYPASDQTGTGQAPINNRYTSGSNRQGWTFFQRRPDASYFPGDNGLGWNFRMYNGVGGNTPMDIQSLAPYKVGKWQHVVVTYDPVSANNATLIIYIDGVAANTNSYSGTDPGYAPCTGDHPPSEATSGQPNLSIGCYNNANTGLNPYFGAVDEFAWYSNKLSPAQILAHYQNATNANRTTPYDVLVKSANPVLYLRLDDIAPSADTAINLGDVRTAGLATHSAEVRHPATGALVGRTDSGAAAYHLRNGNSTTTLPWLIENNPDAGIPFTFETWLRPVRDQNGGMCPVNNRWVGGSGRTGWVIFQRTPNLTYDQGGGEGHGWNFRMYSGVGSGGQDVLTGTDYVVGQWSHLVVTWEPQIDNGDPAGNGNHQFMGVLTAYFNGVPVASNTAALYAANRQITETGSTAADLAVGSYNAASGIGSNPFEGDVGEVALYNNYVLTPDQIAAHYAAGTNSHSATNYETLVFTAGFTGPERTGLPKTYLRFNDPARYPVTNSGTLGALADGTLVLTTNIATGPQSPAYIGFPASNPALPLDGVKQWASFNHPIGLNISGQITLEAWVRPGATQGTTARIISHGPPTLSSFLGLDHDGAVTNSTEVFLRTENGTAYVVGSAESIDGAPATTHSASFPIPAGDLGGANWVQLAGTYDGANWNLYRNGVQVATTPSAVGALAVNDADWAIGSTGNGWADPFAGSIDEVAIYSQALSTSRIAAHYSMAVLGPNPLSITRSGANVTITWPAGTLQESTSLTGPFVDSAGGPSPRTVAPSGTRKFYRVRL
jgi:Concanavalin A-like lectin/glucanases superfamily